MNDVDPQAWLAEILARIADIIPLFSPAECANFFKAAGYDPE